MIAALSITVGGCVLLLQNVRHMSKRFRSGEEMANF